MSAEERIVVNPQIYGGKPTIRGTRIMVKNILGMLAGGYTVERVLQAYPELSKRVSKKARCSWFDRLTTSGPSAEGRSP
ncbi:MAG: DUF433 domain-containing protein [SAR202 cluster bacterium]|nr:DUF433 domain-containing protein [SAR202 cluster bacterium]